MKKFVSYFEIPVANFSRAVKFYELVFNLTLEVRSYGESRKMAFFPKVNGKYEGAISKSPACVPLNNGVFISFQVDNIDLIIERIKENGGIIVHPKQKIEEEGFGYSSLFIDTEGNRIGLSSD
ncbi:MAG: VOC family protein [Bacteroides sp.]|nr:VOC family protein [Bacteroides sp.]